MSTGKKWHCKPFYFKCSSYFEQYNFLSNGNTTLHLYFKCIGESCIKEEIQWTFRLRIQIQIYINYKRAFDLIFFYCVYHSLLRFLKFHSNLIEFENCIPNVYGSSNSFRNRIRICIGNAHFIIHNPQTSSSSDILRVTKPNFRRKKQYNQLTNIKLTIFFALLL